MMGLRTDRLRPEGIQDGSLVLELDGWEGNSIRQQVAARFRSSPEGLDDGTSNDVEESCPYRRLSSGLSSRQKSKKNGALVGPSMGKPFVALVKEWNVEGSRGRTPANIADCCVVSEDVVTSHGIREGDWGGVAQGEK